MAENATVYEEIVVTFKDRQTRQITLKRARYQMQATPSGNILTVVDGDGDMLIANFTEVATLFLRPAAVQPAKIVPVAS